MRQELDGSAFLGNKQENYIKWLQKEYKDADTDLCKRIDKAVVIMRNELQTLDYESFKDSFRNKEITKDERLFNNKKLVQKEAKRLGVSKADAFKTFVYTDYENHLSSELAQYLYNDKAPEIWSVNQLLTYKKQLTKTFKKLPKYKGVVYRNLKDIPKDILAQWTKKGNTLEWGGFSSATMDADKYKDREVRLIIETKNAHIIENLSMYPEEKEAVLLPGTRLHIDSVTKNGVQTIIELTEL